MNPLASNRSRFLLASFLLLIGLIVNGLSVLAQRPADLSPEIKAELARSPVPPPRNEDVGIDIDRFIGHPSQSSVRVSHDVIMMRTIFYE